MTTTVSKSLCDHSDKEKQSSTPAVKLLQMPLTIWGEKRIIHTVVSRHVTKERQTEYNWKEDFSLENSGEQ